MIAALASYQFDEQPVRIVTIAGEPWFVATDVAIVLGYRDAANMARSLDDDERGTHNLSTLGGEQTLTIISESGLYAVILKSRREEARRFRKWVTAEVLPTIRREGQYRLAAADLVENDYPGADDLDAPQLMAKISVIREARRLFGQRAARQIWGQLGLPIGTADLPAADRGDPLADPLKDWLADRTSCTILEAASGLGLAGADVDFSIRRRLGALLALFGWTSKVVRRGHGTVRLYHAPAHPGANA